METSTEQWFEVHWFGVDESWWKNSNHYDELTAIYEANKLRDGTNPPRAIKIVKVTTIMLLEDHLTILGE